MYFLLSSLDNTLRVRVQNIDSHELRDTKTKRVIGVSFVANGETPMYTDVTLQKRPANSDQARQLIAETQEILAELLATEEAAKAQAAAPPAVPATVPGPATDAPVSPLAHSE